MKKTILILTFFTVLGTLSFSHPANAESRTRRKCYRFPKRWCVNLPVKSEPSTPTNSTESESFDDLEVEQSEKRPFCIVEGTTGYKFALGQTKQDACDKLWSKINATPFNMTGGYQSGEIDTYGESVLRGDCSPKSFTVTLHGVADLSKALDRAQNRNLKNCTFSIY